VSYYVDHTHTHTHTHTVGYSGSKSGLGVSHTEGNWRLWEHNDTDTVLYEVSKVNNKPRN